MAAFEQQMRRKAHYVIQLKYLWGDACEYLIGQFAVGSGKKAGEFDTPSPFPTSSRPSSPWNAFLAELGLAPLP